MSPKIRNFKNRFQVSNYYLRTVSPIVSVSGAKVCSFSNAGEHGIQIDGRYIIFDNYRRWRNTASLVNLLTLHGFILFLFYAPFECNLLFTVSLIIPFLIEYLITKLDDNIGTSSDELLITNTQTATIRTDLKIKAQQLSQSKGTGLDIDEETPIKNPLCLKMGRYKADLRRQ